MKVVFVDGESIPARYMNGSKDFDSVDSIVLRTESGSRRYIKMLKFVHDHSQSVSARTSGFVTEYPPVEVDRIVSVDTTPPWNTGERVMDLDGKYYVAIEDWAQVS